MRSGPQPAALVVPVVVAGCVDFDADEPAVVFDFLLVDRRLVLADLAGDFPVAAGFAAALDAPEAGDAAAFVEAEVFALEVAGFELELRVDAVPEVAFAVAGLVELVLPADEAGAALVEPFDGVLFFDPGGRPRRAGGFTGETLPTAVTAAVDTFLTAPPTRSAAPPTRSAAPPAAEPASRAMRPARLVTSSRAAAS
ncbi:MAG: hypothetical protein ACJ761_11535 [Chloroflexota bacterium]